MPGWTEYSLILKLSAKIFPVQTRDVRDSDVLRALHLTGACVGAGAESEFVHLSHHSLCTLCGLYLTLRKESEGTYAGSHEKHRRAVLAGCHAGTAADAGSAVHALLGLFARNRNGIGVRNSAGSYRDISPCLKNLVKRLTVNYKILDYRETVTSPRLDGDCVTVLELTHVKLAGCYLIVRSMRASVDIE